MNNLDKLAQDIEAKREVLSNARNKLLSKRNKVIVFVVLTTLIVGCSTLGQAGFFIAIVVSVLTYFLFEFLVNKKLKSLGLDDFKREFKNLVFVPALEHYGDNLAYDPFKTIPKESLIASALFQRIEKFKYKGDDYASGKYKGYNFIFSEIHLSEMRRTTSGNTSQSKKVSIFDGILMQFEAPSYSDFRLFFVPDKEVSQPSVDFTKIKFRRDPNMTLQEQRAYNLQIVSSSFNAFMWDPDRSGYDLQDIKTPSSNDQFKLYTNQPEEAEKLKSSGAFSYLEENLIQGEESDDRMIRSAKRSEMDNNSLRGAFFSINEGKFTILFPHPMPQFEPDISKPVEAGLLKANFQYLEGMFKVVDGVLEVK